MLDFNCAVEYKEDKHCLPRNKQAHVRSKYTTKRQFIKGKKETPSANSGVSTKILSEYAGRMGKSSARTKIGT